MSHVFNEEALHDDYQAVEEFLTLQHLHYVLSTNDDNRSLLQFISTDPFYRRHLFKSAKGKSLESIGVQESVTENLSNILKLARRMLAKAGLVSPNEAAALRKEAKNIDKDITDQTNSLLKKTRDGVYVQHDTKLIDLEVSHTYDVMISVAKMVVLLGNTINKLIRDSVYNQTDTDFFDSVKESVERILSDFDVAVHPNGSFSLTMKALTDKTNEDDHFHQKWGTVNSGTLRNVLHGVAAMAHCEIICYPISEIITTKEQPEDIDPLKKKYQLFCLNLMISYVKAVRSISTGYIHDVETLDRHYRMN